MGLDRHLSAPGAWAYSIGTSVGWGSLVVTASAYLGQAGPLGSTVGLVIGAVVMILVACCYSYMMRAFPEAGGAYAFTRGIFGYDYGFLAAWFMSITYLAILWANATSLPLFGRIFLGGFFRFGKLYTIFGYEVYLGEVLLASGALILVALLCMHWKRLVNGMMILMASSFTVGIAVCFIAAIFKKDGSMDPMLLEDSSALSQIVKIAVISPWAFIGFESISHGAEEFKFKSWKFHRVLLISVISTLALYVMVTLLSVTAYPAQYGSWLDYIKDLDHLEGIEALPAFYAAKFYLGQAGVTILTLSLLALVLTSLIGNMTALSRLFYAMSKDRILPKKIGELNRRRIPAKAILLVTGLSVLIPFVGRTAIGWIVDVTTIGATIIYGFVAAATIRLAKEKDDHRERRIGWISLVVMIGFGAYILIPNLVSQGSIARETYMLFIFWSVLGFLFFRSVLYKDRERRFGTSAAVWVALLSLVLFVSLVWMRQSMMASDDTMRENVESYYTGTENRTPEQDTDYIKKQLEIQSSDTSRTMIMGLGMFSFVMIIMLTNHSYMNKRSAESERQANTDSMTGVRNKHAFMASEKEFDRLIKEETVGNFAVVVCDVNGLKKINDTLGHKAGDEYIREACRMVCEIFQHSPVFRIGGDEFVAILNGRDFPVRRELMRLLHDRSAKHIGSGGAVVSGGISDFVPGEDPDFHTVFARADALMYEEKKILKSLGAVTRDDESDQAAATKEQKSTDAAAEAGKDGNVNTENAPILKVRRHILIVDDEKINSQILGYMLEESYDLLYAEDGVTALNVAEQNKEELALILLDHTMRRMGGTETLKRLKADPALRKIPVIMFSADPTQEVECLKLGAADFLPKPYPDPEIIRVRAGKCIELSEDQRIIRSTERDHVTHLFNMDYFINYVNQFDHYYHNDPMDAVVVDIEQFHLINDRYGREYGDHVLRLLGEGIRQMARRVGGVGCRWAADTFFIYCPHRKDYDELLEKLAESVVSKDVPEGRVQVRMGVYHDVEKKLEIAQRYDRARLAANGVKGHPETVGVYDVRLREYAAFRANLLEDFQDSLEEGWFEVHFQPKYDIRAEHTHPVLVGAEALVRWQHPEYGCLSPGMFISLLEEHSLILELDRYVWETTAAQLAEWKRKYGKVVPVSVNVSRIDLLMPELPKIFTDILKRYGLTTADLSLELTESVYAAGDSEQVISTARELWGMGLRIEMDDFGSGFSSLDLLTRLPIDALKLDISTGQGEPGESDDTQLFDLIFDIAKALDVAVVAEGVETWDEYEMLRSRGCDIAQGTYFSEPLKADAYERLLGGE